MLFQIFLGALDGVAVLVEQVADDLNNLDILWPVITSASAPFHRVDLAEFAFPETQDMLRYTNKISDLAYGAKSIR